jgi:hypothetical protein
LPLVGFLGAGFAETGGLAAGFTTGLAIGLAAGLDPLEVSGFDILLLHLAMSEFQPAHTIRVERQVEQSNFCCINCANSFGC